MLDTTELEVLNSPSSSYKVETTREQNPDILEWFRKMAEGKKEIRGSFFVMNTDSSNRESKSELMGSNHIHREFDQYGAVRVVEWRVVLNDEDHVVGLAESFLNPGDPHLDRFVFYDLVALTHLHQFKQSDVENEALKNDRRRNEIPWQARNGERDVYVPSTDELLEEKQSELKITT